MAVRVTVVMTMIVAVIVRAWADARALFMLLRPQQMQERAALHPQQPQADDDDERVTHLLDDAHGVAHHLRRGAEQHRGDADDGDGGQRLHDGRRKRQHHAALPGLVVGDDVGRDHRLAVAGTGGVEDAVDEGDAEQRPGGAAVGLGGADGARQHAIEFRLFCQNPAGDGAEFRRRGPCEMPNGRAMPRRARQQSSQWQTMRRIAWRSCAAGRTTSCRDYPVCRTPPPRTSAFQDIHQDLCWRIARPRPSSCSAIGRNRCSAPCLPHRSSRAAAPRRLAAMRKIVDVHRLLLGEFEIDENGRVVNFDLQDLRLHRRLERQREMQRQDLVGVVEPVARRRIEQFGFLAVGGDVSEIVDIPLATRR